MADLALNPEPLTARFHAEVAYGFRKGKGLLTPYTQLNMADTSTTYQRRPPLRAGRPAWIWT